MEVTEIGIDTYEDCCDFFSTIDENINQHDEMQKGFLENASLNNNIHHNANNRDGNQKYHSLQDLADNPLTKCSLPSSEVSNIKKNCILYYDVNNGIQFKERKENSFSYKSLLKSQNSFSLCSPLQLKETDEVDLLSTEFHQNLNSDVTSSSSGYHHSCHNVLPYTYRMKNDEFHRIFKMPSDEKLIIDYSCALQKDILIQGRMYISQNFICFYANFFWWETMVVIKCKQIASVTKEKTALVIPNAIQISLNSGDKHFFSSLASRDKTYLMLFRVWQNSLLDQSLNSEEFLKLIHISYGRIGIHPTEEAYIEIKQQENLDLKSEKRIIQSCELDTDKKNFNFTEVDAKSISCESDTSDSCDDAFEKGCSVPHKGKSLLSAVVPVSVDTLFSWLFTKSELILEFHRRRGDKNVYLGEWESLKNGERRRITTYDVETNSNLVKTCHVSETQILEDSSIPCKLYSINVMLINSGIPYAETFKIHKHICLKKLTSNKSSFLVFADIKFMNPPWTLIKSVIEKNAFTGMDAFYTQIRKLIDEFTKDSQFAVHRGRVTSKKKFSHLNHHNYSMKSDLPNSFHSGIELISSSTELRIFFILISVLLMLNLIMVIWCFTREMKECSSTLLPGIFNENHTISNQEWLQLFQKQEQQHRNEIDIWRNIIQNAIKILLEAKQCIDKLSDCDHTSSFILSDFENATNEILNVPTDVHSNHSEF